MGPPEVHHVPGLTQAHFHNTDPIRLWLNHRDSTRVTTSDAKHNAVCRISAHVHDPLAIDAGTGMELSQGELPPLPYGVLASAKAPDSGPDMRRRPFVAPRRVKVASQDGRRVQAAPVEGPTSAPPSSSARAAAAAVVPETQASQEYMTAEAGDVSEPQSGPECEPLPCLEARAQRDASPAPAGSAGYQPRSGPDGALIERWLSVRRMGDSAHNIISPSSLDSSLDNP